ncbi:DUF4363 family protein [Dethiothermospora halolimnae]|uniref:DUF4363 family protein n=1 Tax=Dethiothermospora halolimnae TaxID=3114390 RepID=UPI003CCC13D0
MKTYIVTFAIILLIIVGWFIIFDKVEYHCESANKSLNKVISHIDNNNWNDAKKEFDKVTDKWSDIRSSWSILLDHHEIDNIDLSMAKTNKYVSSKNPSLSLAEIEVLKKLFNIVKENEALTLTNIL